MPAYRPRPYDFALHATEPCSDLCARYGCTETTVLRWRKELGVTVRRGAPRGNQNHLTHYDARDSRAQIRICLSCERPKCSGWCRKLRAPAGETAGGAK